MRFVVYTDGETSTVEETDRRLGSWPAYVDEIQEGGILFKRGRYTKTRGGSRRSKEKNENDVDELLGDAEFQAADDLLAEVW